MCRSSSPRLGQRIGDNCDILGENGRVLKPQTEDGRNEVQASIQPSPRALEEAKLIGRSNPEDGSVHVESMTDETVAHRRSSLKPRRDKRRF
jgi:hypothetical protein